MDTNPASDSCSGGRHQTQDEDAKEKKLGSWGWCPSVPTSPESRTGTVSEGFWSNFNTQLIQLFDVATALVYS